MQTMPEHDDISIELEEAPEPRVIRRPRPNESTHAVAQSGDGPPCEPEVYVDVGALEQMFVDARSFRDTETGGLLAGDLCEDANGQYLRVVAALPARHAGHSSTSLTFTHESWNAMLEDRARLYPRHEVVGWYHTHPGMRVFLSQPDLFIHYSFFGRPQDVAIVLDLHKREWGVFRWRGQRLELAPRFFVYAENPEDGARLSEILGEFAPRTGRDQALS